MLRKICFARKSFLLAAILVSASLAVWLGRVMAANSGGSNDQFLAHLSTDKPIYRGGERVYFRAVVLAADNHTPLSAEQQAYPYGTLQITGPRGERVATGQAMLQDSIAAGSWDIPADISGGQYTATLTLPALGTSPAVRKFDVRQYRVPRLKGEIIFIRDGFGAGDTVNASLHVDRAEGGLPVGADVTATAIVDGATAFTGQTKIDASGNCAVSFLLPAQIQTDDGTLSLAINDGGTVETIAKTIPILVKTLDIAFYPEGGDLVAGIPNRVYFEARTPARKPADLDGTLIGSNGKEVGPIRSEHEGRGRFTFTPIAGQTYSLKIAHPAGIDKTFALPEIKPAGVSLQSTQDVVEPRKAVMLSLYSSMAKNYTVVLRKHQTEISAVTVAANAGAESPVVMTPPSWADGVLVATVFDSSGTPVAERLIFCTGSAGIGE